MTEEQIVGKYWTHPQEEECGVPGRHVHYGQNVVLHIPEELAGLFGALCEARDAERWAKHQLATEVERLTKIETAARNLDQHSTSGYASLVSYLIRLREALEEDAGRTSVHSHSTPYEVGSDSSAPRQS